MDDATQAALMLKARKVFAGDNTFLSFPVTPLPFAAKDLQLQGGTSAEDVRKTWQNLQSFSTLVNLLPDDEAWLPSDPRFLWDAYGQVLAEADFATSSRTADEEARYAAALAVLRDTDTQGNWTDSAAALRYRQYKDAVLVAQQRYAAARETAESDSDPARRARWSDTEEPVLRAEIDELQAHWVLDGFKSAVEAAQATVVSLGARSPIQTWAEWRSRFNPDLSGQTGLSDTSLFFPSFFSPTNAVDDAAWQPFQLSADEVAQLLRDAPPEIRSRLQNTKVGGDALSFEFSSAAVMRPWFSPDLFRARFWRLADANRMVSDGGDPAAGLCPAYVTALVFARRVKVRPPAAAAPAEPFAGFRFAVAVRDAQLRENLRLRPEALGRAALPPLARLTPAVATALRGRASLAPGPMAVAAAPSLARMRPILAAGRLGAMPARTPPPQQVLIPRLPLRLLKQFAVDENTTEPAQPPVTPGAPSPGPSSAGSAAPGTSAREGTDADTVFILAFICKRVPRCPDPDHSLRW